jgi:hypothetical protein
MTENKVKRASFSLEEKYQELLAEIASIGRRSMTDEIRMMIDKRAVELGLSPIAPVHPKQMASIREASRRTANRVPA